jgi:hypothetical protein
MQDTSMLGKTMGLCPNCGKPTVIRSTRDKKSQYCSRVCAGITRFATRYQGSMSGPFDRPVDIQSKRSFNG